jgi:predicted aldo/keto reductase-like oxidoreductase
MRKAAYDSLLNRREFIQKSAVAAGAAVLGGRLGALHAAPSPGSATDWVQLGRKAGLKIPRLGIGTGSVGGSIQRNLGQDGFTRLIRYAYDQGVRYIDTADNYKTHEMIREAIKGLPREKVFIQSKMPIRPEIVSNPLAALERYRKELGVEYIDNLLIHCATKGTWVEDLKPMMDAFDEAQAKGWIRAKGVSCHGLAPLRAATSNRWIEVQLARINPQGRYVDGDSPQVMAPEGNVSEAMKEVHAMHQSGRGIIAMKLVGNGDFTNVEDREKAVQYAVNCGCVDAMVIGFKSPAEVDEAVERLNRALKTKAAKVAA